MGTHCTFTNFSLAHIDGSRTTDCNARACCKLPNAYLDAHSRVACHLHASLSKYSICNAYSTILSHAFAPAPILNAAKWNSNRVIARCRSHQSAGGRNAYRPNGPAVALVQDTRRVSVQNQMTQAHKHKEKGKDLDQILRENLTFSTRRCLASASERRA